MLRTMLNLFSLSVVLLSWTSCSTKSADRSLDDLLLEYGDPYFGNVLKNDAQVVGYLIDREDGSVHGFGYDMLHPEKDFDVMLFHLESNLVKDHVIVLGGVTDEMLDGGAINYFGRRPGREF